MDLLLQQVCNGLVIGSTYAVVALGFALAFSVLRVVHFAHPDIFMVGMFAGLVAANYWPGLGLVIALGALLGYSLYHRHAPVHTAVATSAAGVTSRQATLLVYHPLPR